MRPLKLTLQAFGSFAGHEEVDFEALAPRGLFVVSGDTGTGKTTIFDAMCWALYGTMPLKESDGVRSDHVGDDVRTEVTFAFECDGVRYEVTRNPEQLKTGARGRPVREPAAAHLTKVTAGGTEAVATGAKPTAAACEAVIGLDATQFQRVILLPQGEFSRFLLADTNERERLLSALFGGRIFDRIVEELKADLAAARGAVGSVDHDIDTQLVAARTQLGHAAAALGREVPDGFDEADRDAVVAFLEGLAEPLAECGSRAAALAVSATEAEQARDIAEAAATRFASAARHREAVASLAAREPTAIEAAEAAARSAAARPLVEAAEAAARAEAALVAAVERRDAARSEVLARFTALGVEADASSTASLTAQRAERATVHTEQRGRIVELDAARDAVRTTSERAERITQEIERCETARGAARHAVDEATTKLPDARAAAVDTTALDAAIARLEEAQRVRATLDTATAEMASAVEASAVAAQRQREVLDAFVATQAPRLADTLVPGAPCPVCGATEHPAPARSDDGATVGFAEVERANAERERAGTRASDATERVTDLRGRLGADADRTEEQLAEELATSRASRAAAIEAAQTVEKLEAQLATATDALHEAERELAAVQERGAAVAAEQQAAATRLQDAEAAAAGLDPAALDADGAHLDALGVEIPRLDDCYEAVQLADGRHGQAQEQLAHVFGDAPFATVDEARAALLAPAEEASARQALVRLREDRAQAQGALDELAAQGIPESAPDVEAARGAAADARRSSDAALAAHTTAANSAQYATDALTRLDELAAGSADLRSHAADLERAHKVCNSGGPGAAMSLKRWVLTRELDRVAAAANVHLHRMTGGRYGLRRSEERTDGRRAFGLDLEVTDTETGRPRSPKSLSGGEQFQASLSLALGLADVVSHGGTASGRTFDALFVDEGFGSLSAESLDDAIETLHQLHATGRMVGAITHVEAMKQNLHVGIEVRRREDRRGSTLTVRP